MGRPRKVKEEPKRVVKREIKKTIKKVVKKAEPVQPKMFCTRDRSIVEKLQKKINIKSLYIIDSFTGAKEYILDCTPEKAEQLLKEEG